MVYDFIFLFFVFMYVYNIPVLHHLHYVPIKTGPEHNWL